MVRFAVPPVSTSGPAVHSSSVSVVAIIPARYESSRFPGKALAEIAGKPMIEHVYRRTSAARSVGVVIVATDDERICDAVEKFGGRAQLTSPKHLSGTDRLAEVAAGLTCDVVVNVQGDEPLVDPSSIDDAIAPFKTDRDLQMTTLRRRIEDDPRRFYYPFMLLVLVIIAGALHLALPVELVQISANMSNLGALMFPFALMYLNSRLPRPARPRWWHYVILGLNVVFFGFFFVNFVYEFFTGGPLVRF